MGMLSVGSKSEADALTSYKQQRAGVADAATLDDIWNAYRLFLAREPDPDGFAAYAALVRRGTPVAEFARMFMSSPEFAQRVQAPFDPTITLAELDGFRLFVPASDAVVGEEILARRTYEPHVTGVLLSTLGTGQVFVDVGANIGYFSVLAARTVGPSGHVTAIEPLVRNVRLLLANAALNGLDNIDVKPFAVAEREGFLTLMSMGSIASSRELRFDDLTTTNALEFSYASTIDTIVGDACVDVLKIDIDGFDHKAMVGAKTCLERWRPQLFIEFSPDALARFSGIEPIAYLRFLAACGYRSFSVLRRDAAPMKASIDQIAGLPLALGLTHIDLHVQAD